MGWGSASDIFDPVAQALVDAKVGDAVLKRVLVPLIRKLQDEDWDTEDESLEAFGPADCRYRLRPVAHRRPSAATRGRSSTVNSAPVRRLAAELEAGADR